MRDEIALGRKIRVRDLLSKGPVCFVFSRKSSTTALNTHTTPFSNFFPSSFFSAGFRTANHNAARELDVQSRRRVGRPWCCASANRSQLFFGSNSRNGRLARSNLLRSSFSTVGSFPFNEIRPSLG